MLGVHWKHWCWSWNSNTLATSCEELTRWKRCWCWGGLGAGGEGDDRGWDGWMASPTWWTWVWVNSRSWWWTGRPGVPRFMGSQVVDTTELNWLISTSEIFWGLPRLCWLPPLIFFWISVRLMPYYLLFGFVTTKLSVFARILAEHILRRRI